MHRALVDQAKGGDRKAFDALARTVGDRCMAIAFRILRERRPGRPGQTAQERAEVQAILDSLQIDP